LRLNKIRNVISQLLKGYSNDSIILCIHIVSCTQNPLNQVTVTLKVKVKGQVKVI